MEFGPCDTLIALFHILDLSKVLVVLLEQGLQFTCIILIVNF